MEARPLTPPELVLIAGTRMALGIGIGLLIGDRLEPEAKRAAGYALLAVGVLSTIPLAATVLGRPPLTENG